MPEFFRSLSYRLRPFPSASLRTVQAGFQAYGSPVAGFSGGQLLASRLPCSLLFRSTCPPSPCGRLSRPRTTMRAPSPWGSRPTGDLVLLSRSTSERGLGRPLIPTPDDIRRYPPARACVTSYPQATHAVASLPVSLMTGLRMGRSGLDFRQSSFGHATRVLRNCGFADLPALRVSGMLWSSVPFGRESAG